MVGNAMGTLLTLAPGKDWRERSRAAQEYAVSRRKARQREARRRRKARVKAAEGAYTAEDVETLFDLQSGLYCGVPLVVGEAEAVEVDHMHPLSRGGSNWPENLALACEPCNRSKSDKTAEEYKAVLQPRLDAALAQAKQQYQAARVLKAAGASK